MQFSKSRCKKTAVLCSKVYSELSTVYSVHCSGLYSAFEWSEYSEVQLTAKLLSLVQNNWQCTVLLPQRAGGSKGESGVAASGHCTAL